MPQTILVVDDDQDLRLSLADILQEEGYEVRTAANGREALDLLCSGVRPTAVVLDLMMRELNGYAVLQSMQADLELKRIPVLVISASFKVSELYGVQYLAKPLDVDDFLSALNRTIAMTGADTAHAIGA